VAHRVTPAAHLRGELRLPGDKSISHRALIFAAIANGETLISGAGDGHDVRSTAGMMAALGASCERLPAAPDDAPGTARWHVRSPGRRALAAHGDGRLDCGNSGTSARLGAGLVAGVNGVHTLDGDASLRRRPMARVLEPLRAMGVEATGAPGERGETAPLRIVGGTLKGGEWRSKTPSAQVKSCVLIAGLAASGSTTYIESVATRDHSERMLAARGATINRTQGEDGSWSIRVQGEAELRAIPQVHVPGDPSSAAFWLVAASLHPDADLTIRGVSLNPTRRHVIEILRRMGASIEETPGPDDGSGEPVGDLRVRSADLHGVEITPQDVALAIDEMPILSLAATMARGATSIRGAGELRAKESDRIAGVADGLTQLGLHVRVEGDDLHFVGGERPKGGAPAVRGDHRLAMTFAVAALVGGAAVEIDEPEAAAVSYPTFFDDAARVAGGATHGTPA
jgi:3-phosphoshikimate 1-carboxyvinyltransferase